MKRLHGNIMLGNNRALMGCEDLSAVTVEAQVLETGASFGVQITVTDDNGDALPISVDYFNGSYAYIANGSALIEDTNRARVYLRTKSSFNVKLSNMYGDGDEVKVTVSVHQGCKILRFDTVYGWDALHTLNLPDSLQEVYFGHYSSGYGVTPTYPNVTRLALNSEKVKGASESRMSVLSGQSNFPNLAEIGYYKVFVDEETGENYKDFVEELPVSTELIAEGSDGSYAIKGSDIHYIKIYANTTINSGGFSGSAGLISVSVFNATSIGTVAFSDCSSLRHIYLDDSVTSIGNNAFDGCSSLSTIDFLPIGVTTISNELFANCGLTGSIDIPSRITQIGSRAFSGCSITDIFFNIGTYAPYVREAFRGMANLSSVRYPYTKYEWSNRAFSINANFPFSETQQVEVRCSDGGYIYTNNGDDTYSVEEY